MSSAMDQLKAYGDQALTRYRFLSTRERLALHIGAAALLILLFVLLVWLPVHQWKQQQQASLEANTKLLKQVNTVAPQLSNVGQTSKRPSGQSIVSQVLQSASRSKIEYTRYEPRGKGVRLILDDVSFNKLVKWLDQLNQSSDIVVSSMNMEPKPDLPGRVKATVELAGV